MVFYNSIDKLHYLPLTLGSTILGSDSIQGLALCPFGKLNLSLFGLVDFFCPFWDCCSVNYVRGWSLPGLSVTLTKQLC